MDSPVIYWGKIILLSGAVIGAIIALVIYLTDQANQKNVKQKLDSLEIPLKNLELNPIKKEEPKKESKMETPKEEKATNTQHVEKGGRAIQNNAPNNGVQVVGDVSNFSNEPEFTVKEINEFVESVKKIMMENKLDNLIFNMAQGSNGGKIKQQVTKALNQVGIEIHGEGIAVSASTPNGTTASIMGNTLNVTFGRYSTGEK